jgi:hypothetical protein
MNSRQYCSSWPKWRGWCSPPGARSRRKRSLLIRPLLLASMASLSGCQAPIQCQSMARPISLGHLDINPGSYLYGIKCQEVLK